MTKNCPDSPNGEHAYSPDWEYAQKKGLGADAPICCEYCGDEPPVPAKPACDCGGPYPCEHM